MHEGEFTIAEDGVADSGVGLPFGVKRCAIAAPDVYLLVNPQFDPRSAQIEIGSRSFPFVSCTMPAAAIFRENLLAEVDRTVEDLFVLATDTKARIGRDILPEWTIAGGHTAFIEVPQQQRGPFDIAVERGSGSTIELDRGTPYYFEALVAAHNARGELVLAVADRAGGTQTRVVPFDDLYRGGRQSWDYKRIVIEIPRSSVSRNASMRLRFVQHSNPVGEKPGLLFVAKMFLGRREPATVSKHQSEIDGGGGERGWVLRCGLSLHSLRGSDHDLVLRVGNATATLLPFRSADVEIRTYHDTRIELISNQQRLFSYYVDGVFAFNVELGQKPTTIPFDPVDFDGQIHNIAVRDCHGVFTYAEDYIIFPASLTPYDVLQRETTQPLPSYLAPQARFRYFALKKHIERSAAKPAHFAVVAHAHQVLECGFEGLTRFPPIEFDTVDNPDVSVIIPVFNQFNVTYYCLCALIVAVNKASFEVIVVDDGSTDQTIHIADVARGVRVVRREGPEGFVSACNAGAEVARGRYLAFLNNDTEATAGWLDELLSVFTSFASVGLAGSKLLYPNGRLQEAGGIVWRSGNPWNYGRNQNPWDPRFCYVRQVDYVSGAAIMVPAAVWKEVGGFSDDFRPAYFEDTDLAFKVRAAGYKTCFAPHSIVYHFEGLSNGTDPSSGVKQFQEVNRPKFKKKWALAFREFGEQGVNPDLEKDRGVIGRVAFIDHSTPRPDFDAGGYAAVKEMKLVQALGFKVTFVAQNVAFFGRYTDDLRRLGVEVVCAPFVLSVSEFIEKRGQEFAAFYITRYTVAKDAIPLIRSFAPQAKIIFNIADLHFLRELRTGIAAGNRQQIEGAVRIRDEELSVMRQTDIVLSYSSIEHVVILSHNLDSTKVVTCPWVVEVVGQVPAFSERRGIAFIGNYNHLPNVEAVEFFVRQVIPGLRERISGVAFHVYGTKAPGSIEALACDDVIIEGYVEDLNEVFGSHRIFVAPLLSGAGVKGKVLSAMSYGAPSVLSPVAVEGIPVIPGTHCVVANTPAEWVDAIVRLYSDEATWTMMSEGAKTLMNERYSFANGVELMREAFRAANVS